MVPAPASSPDFRLYQSNALEVLAGLLAAEVARAPAGAPLLAPDIVLVPQHAMRRWLQWQLADRLGICANLRFLAPGQFVDLALAGNLGEAPEADRLAPEVLRWHLLRELQQPPAGLEAYLAGADDPRRPWLLAETLAGTFEKYQAWRRDWLLQWERAAPRDDWQAQLWRRVGRGRAHRARRIDDYLAAFGRDGRAPARLPPRLFVFACQNVSPDVLQVIASQSRAGTQHWYLHTPVRPYWGDLARFAGDYSPGRDDDFLGSAEPNPLLASWGMAGRDFVASLGGGEDVPTRVELASFAEPPRDTLLGRMQADLLDNVPALHRAPEAPPEPYWPRHAVDRTDASLQFHACHTRLREVQVLHDQLRALLDAGPACGEAPLEPRDIAVLAPDIDAYAPHVDAVFGGALGTPRQLPYTLADTSALASTPLARVFLRLCALPLQPLSVGELLDVLAVPALAARFGIDAQEHTHLADWLAAAGARWGLDGTDRAAVLDGDADGQAEAAPFTVEFAIQRLLLGYASGDDADIAGVAPWPGLEGQASATLDALLRCLALLRETRAALGGAQSPAAWQRALGRLLDDAFAVDRDTPDAVVVERIRAVIRDFATGAAQAGYDAPIPHAIVHAHLRDALADADPRAPFLSGGICFGRMVPMRNIPFRVVCVLGLDESAFPASDTQDALNRLAASLDTRDRRVGDPSRRDADRYLFLQLFASAGRVLYLSWRGMDPRDNARREPSTVVSELLAVASRYHAGDPDTVQEALVVRHALQPFSPAAFGAPHEGEQLPEGSALEPRRFSFDARWHPSAALAAGTEATALFAPAGFRLGARPDDAPGVVELDRLRRALQRPHATYLQEGLGLRLPEDEPPLPEHEPMGAPDPLSRHGLRHAVFDAWLREGHAPAPAVLHARLLARGLVGPGADGLATVGDMIEDVAAFASLALAHGFGGVSTTVPVDIACGRHVLQGSLAGAYGKRLLRVVLGDRPPHGGYRLRHGLDGLCAAASGLELHELSIPDEGEPPRLERLPLPDEANAIAALCWLLSLRDAALREPLVFLPKSSWSFANARTPASGWTAARTCWLGNDYGVHAEATAATRIALRGRDPFLDEDEAARARFVALGEAVWSALEGGVPPGAVIEAVP